MPFNLGLHFICSIYTEKLQLINLISIQDKMQISLSFAAALNSARESDHFWSSFANWIGWQNLCFGRVSAWRDLSRLKIYDRRKGTKLLYVLCSAVRDDVIINVAARAN